MTIRNILLAILCLSASSCEEFVEVAVSDSEVTKDIVFSSDITATSAMTGVYSDMYNIGSSFASGNYTSVTALCGISGDEFDYYPDEPDFLAFGNYSIDPANPNILNLWKSLYYTVYGANSVLEGLATSVGVSPAARKQLEGEALVTRSFAYFNLVSIFGDVPMVLSTDYAVNRTLQRADVNNVLTQVTTDLERARDLLSDRYPTSERVRPNNAVASALLARVYLYTEQWSNADKESTAVIENNLYKLSALNDVFMANSSETLWQLRPSLPYGNTNEANMFVLTDPPMSGSRPFALTPSLVDAFDENDERLMNWVGELVIAPEEFYYYPFKYKATGDALVEYSMVLRLAEQYLIRAEARARQNNFAGAIADLDTVRNRAGIELYSDIGFNGGVEDFVDLVLRERQLELFSEWGHRWFDLKRTGRFENVLGGLPGFSETDLHYPLPKIEFQRNPALGNQNDGYAK